MDDRQRRAREEAKEALEKIMREAELLRSAVAETRQRISESHQLLARTPHRKAPPANSQPSTGEQPPPCDEKHR
jgi:hypothetical protein